MDSLPFVIADKRFTIEANCLKFAGLVGERYLIDGVTIGEFDTLAKLVQ